MIRNSLFTFLGFFTETSYDLLEYKRKNSFVIGFEDAIQFKKAILNIKFYQNIPTKIYKWIEDDSDDFDIGGITQGYGLGKLLVSLSVPLD